MTSNRHIPLAVQLWSVRTEMARDPAGTLQQLAAMGYTGIETAGTYDLSGEQFRALLDSAGLQCVGMHVGLDALEGDALAATIAMAGALGTDRLIVPSADLDNLATTIDRLNQAHAQAKQAGLRVGFHNHAREFDLVDGTTIFDRIMSGTPADFLVQVDIGWAAAAGQDLPALLRNYAARIETPHIKEFSHTTPTAPVGAGEIDWPNIFDLLERETAVQWYVIEHEQHAVGPLESVGACLANIRQLGR